MRQKRLWTLLTTAGQELGNRDTYVGNTATLESEAACGCTVGELGQGVAGFRACQKLPDNAKEQQAG